MKKTLLIPALLAGSLALATDYSYEISPMIGYNFNEAQLDLNNHMMYGLEAQFNDIGEDIHPELSIFYSNGEYNALDEDVDMFRIALNGVYEFEETAGITPLAKAGAGYRTLDPQKDETVDTMFFDAGVGAKLALTDAVALKAEAVYLLDYNSKRWDSNLAVLAGLSIAFGEKAQKAAPVQEESTQAEVKEEAKPEPVEEVKEEAVVAAAAVAVVDGDDDNDSVPNSKDECPNTKEGATVNEKGCFVNPDTDNDGVLNENDKCPNTPSAVTAVDAEGCIKEVNLHITFKTGSSNVDEQSKQNVAAFANFLKHAPVYKAQIVGYTDSVGKAGSNQRLSERRANIVKDLVIAEGVDASRVSAKGMGEENPIASNETKEGRAQNRRIEAVLSK